MTSPDQTPSWMICFECGLPDLHNGHGDGVGSCMCPRCEWCGFAPGLCCNDCHIDDPAWRPS